MKLLLRYTEKHQCLLSFFFTQDDNTGTYEAIVNPAIRIKVDEDNYNGKS